MNISVILSYFLLFLSGISVGVAFIMWDIPNARVSVHVYNGIMCFLLCIVLVIAGTIEISSK